ncbi:MAG: hypothetical protein ABH854_04415 [Candidatus Diapherotrites archaeon]
MYHVGKVLAVYGADKKDAVSANMGTQATVEMWDEFMLTFNVNDVIAPALKENDIVLVDYSPQGNPPVPKNLIVKILKGAAGKKAWKLYRDYLEKRKQGAKGAKNAVAMPMPAMQMPDAMPMGGMVR